MTGWIATIFSKTLGPNVKTYLATADLMPQRFSSDLLTRRPVTSSEFFAHSTDGIPLFSRNSN
jgi:hypothetical protein